MPVGPCMFSMLVFLPSGVRPVVSDDVGEGRCLVCLFQIAIYTLQQNLTQQTAISLVCSLSTLRLGSNSL